MPTHVGSVVLDPKVVFDPDVVLTDLGITPGATIDLHRLATGLRIIGDANRYRAVWLTPTGSGDTVSFRPVLQPAPQRAFGVGVAFDQFMSGRLWIGGLDRTLRHGDAEGVVELKLGSYEQDGLAFIRRRALVRGSYIPFTVSIQLTHESVRLFQGSGELPNAETRGGELFIGLHQDPAIGLWRGDVGFDERLWREPGRDSRGAYGMRASAYIARTEYELGTIVEAVALSDYQRVRLDANEDWHIGSVGVRGRIRLGWGNRLPLQETFTLGGMDGFAGLRIEELRGSQEAFGSLLLTQRLNSLFTIRAEPMVGMVGTGHGALRRDPGTYYGNLYSGVRAGFQTDTPIGPIRVEEGINSYGTRATLIRVGYWF
jgi:hypothetical protein